VQVVKSFREYGAKLAPEPKKKCTDKRKITMWTDDMVEQLIALHREGLTFTQIGERMGISKSSVASKVRTLIEADVLKSRVEEIAWPAEDIELMMQLRAEGRTWGEIADRLGRKITACHNAYGRERERREKCQKG
jgi:DNA-directed RNA polymerase specialized sigma24 family protein